MSRTNHRKNTRTRDTRAGSAGRRYGHAANSRLTPPSRTSPEPTRVPKNAGGTGDVATWAASDVRKVKAVLKRHGRRVTRQRRKRELG